MPDGADYTRVTFTCPLCQHRLSSTKLTHHLHKKHPDVQESDFMRALEQRLRAGHVRFEVSGKRYPAVSATTLLANERRTNVTGVLKMFNAGRAGVKKSRT